MRFRQGSRAAPGQPVIRAYQESRGVKVMTSEELCTAEADMISRLGAATQNPSFSAGALRTHRRQWRGEFRYVQTHANSPENPASRA